MPVTAFADRKKALAAARSRCSLSITSTRAPARLRDTDIANHHAPNVCLVDVPASADFAFSSPTQVLSQCWGKFGFPIPHGLIAEDEPADQEHFRQIPQAELVAKPPEHHESNDITRVLGSVQEAGAALVELLAAITAAEPAIALRRPLRSVPDGR